jgi:hypothetical protein
MLHQVNARYENSKNEDDDDDMKTSFVKSISDAGCLSDGGSKREM